MSEVLPIIPGHWATSDGAEMAARCVGEDRSQLTKGDLSDFALANAQFLASRHDLDLIVYQTAAKERIRWLSAQLARAQAALEPFATLAARNVDADGWNTAGISTSRERILDWIGPSDLRRAREAMPKGWEPEE